MTAYLSILRLLTGGVLAAALFGLTGCATFSEKTERLRRDYATTNFPEAEKIIDKEIAAETNVSPTLVTQSKALDPAIDPLKGDALVYFLDKGMVRLAQEDPAAAVRVLRRSRDALDANFQSTTMDVTREVASLITDDTVRRYHGPDYEQIMVRAMLALADLIVGEGDAYAYAVQIGEKQEEIIGSPLGEVTRNGVQEGYRPRQQYRRVALGAYLQGVIREDTLDRDEAARAYERAISFSGELPLYTSALARVNGKLPPETGEGALHVFYFGGMAPILVESRSNPTDLAIRLAGLAAFLMSEQYAFLAQGPVPVPQVQAVTPQVSPLTVSAGGKQAATETILDLNQVAAQQLDANMPWIIARAVLRRAAKTAIAATSGNAVGRVSDNQDLGNVVSLLVGLVTTSTENADTRSWTTLPATIQALRLSLPAGEQSVSIGGENHLVRIAAGRNSYLLVLDPALQGKMVVLIDRFSRPPQTP